jgi:DNA-binding NarL/FixJ family response regulator
MKEIRIILADDHRMFAVGIENLLKIQKDFKVIGVLNNGREVVQLLKEAPADVLITDMNMPGMDGLSLIQHLKKEKTKLKIIVLSMYDEEEIFKKCIKQGVDAYVLKNADPDELIYTIREVVENRHVAHYQHVLDQAEDDLYSDLDAYKLKFKLSKREFEILKYLAKGQSNREIAEMLHLSIYTVETHRKHIYTKLNVSTSAELIKKAMDMGLG